MQNSERRPNHPIILANVRIRPTNTRRRVKGGRRRTGLALGRGVVGGWRDRLAPGVRFRRRFSAVGQPVAQRVGRWLRHAGQAFEQITQVSKNIYAMPVAARRHAEQDRGSLGAAGERRFLCDKFGISSGWDRVSSEMLKFPVFPVLFRRGLRKPKSLVLPLHYGVKMRISPQLIVLLLFASMPLLAGLGTVRPFLGPFGIDK